MSFFRTGLFIALASLMTFSGCSDLFQKDVKEKSLESNKFKANCELNIDEFSLILEENISESIDCLGKNLKLFVKVVESRRPGYLSRIALENFIKRNRQDIKPEVLRALKSVFDINYLVYGEDPDFISSANIDALVNLAQVFNEKASQNFKPIFLSEDEIDFESYTFLKDKRIQPAAVAVMNGLREIYNPHRNGKIHSLDINNLLDSFTTESNRASIAKVKKFLFAKKILLGGDKDELTHLELDRLITNFNSFVVLTMDAVRFKKIIMNQKETIDFVNSGLSRLRNIIYPLNTNSRNGEFFFSLKDAIDVAEIILKDEDLDLDEYYDLIKEAKLILMQGNSESVTGGDLRRLFDHASNVLTTGHFFHRFWMAERTFLEEDRLNVNIPEGYKFSNLRATFSTETARINQFSRILKQYRFLKGTQAAASYSGNWKRNSESVFEVSVYEYLLKLVMTKYGCPSNTLAGKVVCDVLPTGNQAHWGKEYVYLTKDHVIDLIMRFRKVFHKAKLIYPEREVKTAETITLLGSLFQYQSDENKVFDINEATEFAISLFTAIEISDKLENHYFDLVEQKKCTKDEFDRIEPACFREHFFQAVCFNYPDQFPKLYQALGATVRDPVSRRLICKIPNSLTNAAFLQTSVNAARTCNFYPSNKAEEIYYTKGDLMSIFLGMMHIETTIIRWDVRNENNLMDPAEVMDAYAIYSPALDGFLEKMPSMVKRLKKQIYQYLVKYEQVPNEKEFSSILKFVKFLLSFDKNAPATRKTVGSILVAIGEQGSTNTFNCDCLKNPDNIPQDQSQCSKVDSDTVAARVTRLTRSDMSLAIGIESEPEAQVKAYLQDNFPELGVFLSK
jgi:hypothetical protein